MSDDRHARVHTFLTTEPPWIIRDGLVALLVGALLAGGTIVSQERLDDARANRDRVIAAQQNRHALQIENLRYVRDHSGSGVPGRHFAELDLAGQNLNGLQLRAADFTSANLEGAILMSIDLGPDATSSPDEPFTRLDAANLCRVSFGAANLQGVRFDHANLRGADFRSANLKGASFLGADLTGANLDSQSLDDIVYGDTTIWPTGVKPPMAPNASTTENKSPAPPRPDCST